MCAPRPASAPQLFPLQLAFPSRSNSRTCRLRDRDIRRRCNAAEPLKSLRASLRSLHLAADRLTMTSKRKSESDVERVPNNERCRKRARSEPTLHSGESESASKKKRTERHFSIDLDSLPVLDDERNPEENEECSEGENEDPLLDSVPVNMDPGQLGFLVCAQEALRYLNGRGIPPSHPMFTNLRSRLLRGIGEMSVA